MRTITTGATCEDPDESGIENAISAARRAALGNANAASGAELRSAEGEQSRTAERDRRSAITRGFMQVVDYEAGGISFGDPPSRVSTSANKAQDASLRSDEESLKSGTYTDDRVTLSHYGSPSAATQPQRGGNDGQGVPTDESNHRIDKGPRRRGGGPAVVLLICCNAGFLNRPGF